MSILRSGQITVTTAGTAVQGNNIVTREPLGFLLKALSTNSGKIYVGNDGSDDVTSTNGFELSAGDPPIYVEASNLNELWFDASVNGCKVCWIRVG